MKTKKISVVYIITKLELGGAQKVCLSLFNGLQEQGHETFLISGTKGTLAPTIATKKNVLLFNSLTREISLSGILNELRSFFTLIKTLRALKKQHPELIVHTHSTKAGLMGRWAAFFAGISTRMHTVHGFGFHHHQNKIAWLINYFLELCTSFITTHYICVSTADVRTGKRLFPFFARKSSIIRAAVDDVQFFGATTTKIFPAQNEPFIVGTIACFKKQKNMFDLLQAFHYAYQKNSQLRLEIIGDGQLRSEIENWIAAHNVAEIITLHGWQSQVAPFLKRWHIFALSSLWEGLPCAIVEARSQKLPALCYNVGGIADVIAHGKNGLLSAPKNWRDLAENIIAVSTNQSLYEKLATHNDALDEFFNSSMHQRHIELYQNY